MRERLYRSRRDRMLLGVAGGLARYLDLDPSLVRIVWALLVFAGGAGILLYIVAAIVIPEEPDDRSVGNAEAPADAAEATARVEGSATPGLSPERRAWGYGAGVERRERGGGAVLIGVVLVVIGAWFLLQRFVPAIEPGVVWPVLLVLLGGALVVGATRR